MFRAPQRANLYSVSDVIAEDPLPFRFFSLPIQDSISCTSLGQRDVNKKIKTY